MRVFCIAAVCLAFTAQVFAQTPGSEPASRDEVILYLRTMHSHDMMRKVLEVQSKSMQQLLYDQVKDQQGKVPKDFDVQFKKAMDELIKDMPVDELTQAMIPAYQQHFTKSDIEAMNTFYASPVGQKVLEELPAVMQEGQKAAMPILSKYLSEWSARMQQELKKPAKDPSPAPQGAASPQ